MKNKDGWLCLLALLLTIAIIIFLSAVPKEVSYEVLHTEKALALTIDTASTTQSTSTPVNDSKSPTAQTSLPKVLLDIAWCESRDKQSAVGHNYRTRVITLEDGSTTTEKYVWSKDIGRFQINDFYHLETARKMGLDIYTVEGNTQYALFLYNSNGTRDWNPSKPCWSDIEAWRAREKSYY